MITFEFFRPRNLIVIAIVAIFARSLLDGFVRMVDNGGEKILDNESE